MSHLWYVATAVVSIACTTSPTVPEPNGPDSTGFRSAQPIVIRGVTVVPMTTAATVADRVVVIRDGRVEAIQGAADPVPAGAIEIDAAGKFLMPALTDMHVHVRRDELSRYLKAGVATVRSMWGYSTLAARADSIAAGFLWGPTIFSVSSGLDASPPTWPETQFVDDPLKADSVVGVQAGRGYRAIKIYQRLSRASFDSIVAAARRRGLDYLGHVPTAVDIRHALEARMRSIEHLGGYEVAVSRTGSAGGFIRWADADPSRYSALIAETIANGVWNCPTLAIARRIIGEGGTAATARANYYRFVRELVAAGGKVVAGSDAGIDRTPAGTGLHEELRELVAAGLSPYHALRAATIDAGLLLDRPGHGVLEVGALADLLLLDRNPLSDVTAVENPAGLVRRGQWLSRATLQRL
ncbi:MAG: amidohydrolase family protein [Gemmatimonadales bacterium]